ncbi:MAG: flap endonuclease, partial [Clostridia bacterium]|nr:flap endonuclease [Clostridia bacterium]
MKKLLLIDGHNLLFQMFYGMPSRITNLRGEPIQGTLGFTGALLRIIRMLEPTHIAVLFDGEHENPRAAIDPDYKANRAADDRETPFGQLPDVYLVLDHLGIAHTEIAVGETDDAIAAYARKYASELEIFIVSQDSDYYQLIGETVRIVRYRGDLTTVCCA